MATTLRKHIPCRVKLSNVGMFSTRTGRRSYLCVFLLFMALVTVGVTWTTLEIRRAAKQELAVRAIENMGGYVCLDYQSFIMDFCPAEGKKPLPGLVYKVFGDHFCIDAEEVVFYFPAEKTGPIDCYLRRLPKLRHLVLNGQIVATDLKELSCIQNLEYLELRNLSISTDGLKCLSQFKCLNTLVLPDSVCEADVATLQNQMPQCKISRSRSNVRAYPKTKH